MAACRFARGVRPTGWLRSNSPAVQVRTAMHSRAIEAARARNLRLGGDDPQRRHKSDASKENGGPTIRSMKTTQCAVVHKASEAGLKFSGGSRQFHKWAEITAAHGGEVPEGVEA